MRGNRNKLLLVGIYLILWLGSCSILRKPYITRKRVFTTFDSLEKYFEAEIEAKKKENKVPYRVYISDCVGCYENFDGFHMSKIGIKYLPKNSYKKWRSDRVFKIGRKTYPIYFDYLDYIFTHHGSVKSFDVNSTISIYDQPQNSVFVDVERKIFYTNWDTSSVRGATGECPAYQISNFKVKGFSYKDLDSVIVNTYVKGSNFKKIIKKDFTKTRDNRSRDSSITIYYRMSSANDYKVIISKKYSYKISDIVVDRVEREGKYRCQWIKLKVNGIETKLDDFIFVKPGNE
jgi:hypothetical protein